MGRPRNAKQYLEEIDRVYAEAATANRELTPAERGDVEALLELAESQAGVEKRLKGIGDAGAPLMARLGDGSPAGDRYGGPGDRFIASAEYKKIRDSRPQQFSTGPIEVSDGPLRTKGTLTESTAGGPGGGLVPPYYEPGVVSTLFEPLGVAQLFGQSQVSASQVRYVNEGTATSGAGGVAEGAAKPESTLNYSEATEPIRKLATFLPVSDELLEDAASVQSYLNGRLSLFSNIEEERQILRGGGGNELAGIFGRSGINTLNAGTTIVQGLLNAASGVSGSAHLDPDGVILHPSDWLKLRSARDSAGQYVFGGPAYGQYGQAGVAPSFGGPPVWGMRSAISSVVGPGTVLLGNFSQGAHIYRRGGVSVEASSSHSDWFQKNLTALRAESRLGLAVYRPSAFVAVTGLT